MARSHAPLVGPGQPIEVPHALGAAAPFLALAVLSALLLLIPEVPPGVAAFAAAAFSLAAVGRAVQQRRALRDMQVVDRSCPPAQEGDSPLAPPRLAREPALRARGARASRGGAASGRAIRERRASRRRKPSQPPGHPIQRRRDRGPRQLPRRHGAGERQRRPPRPPPSRRSLGPAVSGTRRRPT